MDALEREREREREREGGRERESLKLRRVLCGCGGRLVRRQGEDRGGGQMLRGKGEGGVRFLDGMRV